MKKLLFAVLAFFALSNFAFAKDVSFTSISKNDTKFLFKDKNIKVVALNENELKDTKGAFWPFIISAVRWGWETYRGWSRISRIWYPLMFGWAREKAY